jgi:hypothetical protein
VRRLDELSRGLAKEVVLWKECNDPLLYLERRAYLGAISDALAGVEEAWVVLAKARRRLEPESGQPGPYGGGMLSPSPLMEPSAVPTHAPGWHTTRNQAERFWRS